MDETIKKAAKVLAEMAVAKMPQGVKRKRHPDYSGVHDIHVDGEHVATISGHKPSNHDARSLSRSPNYRGGGTEHGKVYEVLAPGHASHGYDYSENKSLHTAVHPDHSSPQVEGEHASYRTHRYGDMDSAIHAIVSTHRNNKEFGKGHDPKTRFLHAASQVHDNTDHLEKSKTYAATATRLRDLGHHDLAETLDAHHDAHKAATSGNTVSNEKMEQWTHDARHYAKTKHNYETRTDEPLHPEHHHAATAAIEAHNKLTRQHRGY